MKTSNGASIMQRCLIGLIAMVVIFGALCIMDPLSFRQYDSLVGTNLLESSDVGVTMCVVLYGLASLPLAFLSAFIPVKFSKPVFFIPGWHKL